MRWKRSPSFTKTISASNAKSRSSRARWNCRPKRKLPGFRRGRAICCFGAWSFLGACDLELCSIPFVFLHRLSFSDARVTGLRPALLVSVFLVNVLQDHRDHRGGDGAAMRFAADVAFIHGRECVLRFFRRHEPREPRGCPLLVLRSP